MKRKIVSVIVDEHGVQRGPVTATVVIGSDDWSANNTDGWYVVQGNVEHAGHVTVSGSQKGLALAMVLRTATTASL